MSMFPVEAKIGFGDDKVESAKSAKRNAELAFWGNLTPFILFIVLIFWCYWVNELSLYICDYQKLLRTAVSLFNMRKPVHFIINIPYILLSVFEGLCGETGTSILGGIRC